MAADTNRLENIHKIKPLHRRIAGPQQNLWSFDFMLTCLIVLTFAFFILTLYSIVQANADLLNIAPTRILSFKLLDTSSAATLFITLFGALIVRYQFAIGLLPRINYDSIAGTKHDENNPHQIHKTWQVKIRNTGLGPAIITRIEYCLELKGSKTIHRFDKFDEFAIHLKKIGLEPDLDYWGDNISNGFCLSSKEESMIFEVKNEHLGKIKNFYMVLYFQSQLGDKYCREIFLTSPNSTKLAKQH